jgi:hypothetical protein
MSITYYVVMGSLISVSVFSLWCFKEYLKWYWDL